MELQEKEAQKIKPYRKSLNSRLKAIYIIGQRKVFYRQRIKESSCARKKTVDIDILVISRNGDRKKNVIYQNNKAPIFLEAVLEIEIM